MTYSPKVATYRLLAITLLALALVFGYLLQTHRALFVGLGALGGVLGAILWRRAVHQAHDTLARAQTIREYLALVGATPSGHAHTLVSYGWVLLVLALAWYACRAQFLKAVAVGSSVASATEFCAQWFALRNANSKAPP